MKKLLIGAIILLAVIAAILILTGVYADRILDPFVRSALEQNKPMNHRIEYKKIKINLFKRIIKISDVKMEPVPELNKDENIWMEISVSTIKLTDLDIRKILFDKALSIGDIIILQPEVNVHLPLNPPEEIIDSVKGDRVDRPKKQSLKSISLERILISGGSFKLIRNDVVLASSPAINFVTENINLVKNNQDDPVGYTYGKMRLSLADISLYSESGLYDMRVDDFLANKEDSTIIIKGFRMIPKYDKKEFAGKQEFQSDRIDLVIGEIKLARIGIEQLLAVGTLRISSITLDSVDADIYRDKNNPVNMNRFPLFYNESFLKLGLPVMLDTVMITNSKLLYNEMAEGRTTAGEIILSDFNVSTYALSNQVTDTSIVHEMRLFVNAKVMGEGPMNIELALPLEGNLRDFRCTGSVGAMELFPVNGMLEPLLKMIFKGGKLNRMTFDFTASDNVSNGWMEFLYQDLDVVLLGKESGKEKGFMSFMANSVTMSNNPAAGKDLKIVEIGIERDKNKGLIGYIWRTIQSGMVRTIVPTNKYEIESKPAPEKNKSESRTKKKKGK